MDEGKFEAIVNGLPQTVYEMDLAGRITYANRRGFEFTGYGPEDLEAGMYAMSLFVPEDADRIRANIRAVLQGADEVPNEYTLLTRDGLRIPVLVFSRVIMEDGAPVGLRGVILDNTSRQKVLDDHRASEARYRNLVERAEIGILVHSGGNVVYANPFAAGLMGAASGSDLLGREVVDLVHPESRDAVTNRVKDLYEKRSDTGLQEVTLLRLDGTQYDVEFAASRIDFEGKPAGEVMFRDVTDRKRTERTLLNIAAGVSAAVGQSFFRELMLHLGQALSADYAFIAEPMDQAPERIGTKVVYSGGEIVENFEYDLAGTPCERVMASTSSVFPDGVQELFPDDALVREMDIRGYVGTPLLGSDGSVMGILAVMYRGPVPQVELADSMLEIFAARVVAEMERMRAERERVTLESRLIESQKTESIGRLAGGIAHDINNLITPILGYSELLLEDSSPVDPEVRKMLQVIHSTAARTRGIIEQLLAFGRRQTLEVRAVNLGKVTQDLADMLRTSVPEDIGLEIDTEHATWETKVDVVRMEQVIVNLVVNARDAMPDGGRIIVRVRDVVGAGMEDSGLDLPPGDWVRLDVSDSGTGMSSDTLANVFEPFFTTKPKGQGTGLGLSTVLGIVEQHAGRVTIESELEVGTSVAVLLPRWLGVAEQAPRRESGPSRAGAEETVLVVEDDVPVLDLVVAILKKRGYRVHAANGPRDCLELADTLGQDVDLLITDVVMPGMNGPALFAKMADRIPALKVLYMSGYTDDILDPRGVIERDINFLQKPFSGRQLAAKVREMLD